MLEITVQRERDNRNDFSAFMALLSKYVGENIHELTPTIVNEFVKKIIIHEADHSAGKRVQQIEVIYHFIGEIDYPGITAKIAVTQPANKKNA